MIDARTGVLLVNLGTPDAPTPGAVLDTLQASEGAPTHKDRPHD